MVALGKSDPRKPQACIAACMATANLPSAWKLFVGNWVVFWWFAPAGCEQEHGQLQMVALGESDPLKELLCFMYKAAPASASARARKNEKLPRTPRRTA